VNAPYPDPSRRFLITFSVMLGVAMVALDTTIANVALPQMQSSMSASPDQVVWVLTSYLIASAIMTPLASWLASRFGRKRVITISVAGFTLASLACGLANSLPTMVVARLIQGLCGSGLIPLSMATLLDINPPENHGKAMAVAGLGSMLGPLLGPTVGGWLTDAFSWRWVFLINVPLGVIAFLGVTTYMLEARDKAMARFDFLGFITFSMFLGSFQLMMDRGERADWFESREVWIEALLMVIFGYLALVHIVTGKNTFIRVEVFKDRNFALGCLVSAMVGVVAFATIPMVTIMMQSLLGFTPFQSGLYSLPRGIGTIMGLILVGQLVGKIDARILLGTGLSMTALGLFLYSRMSLGVDVPPLLVAGFIQGFSGGLIISPLSTLVFSTLGPGYRNEGAALFALTRNIGASIGISALGAMTTHNTATVQNRLAEAIRPDNPLLASVSPDFSFDSIESIARMAREIGRQATMVAYIDGFWLTCLLALAMLPFVFLMNSQKRPAAGEASMPQTQVMAE
jgi:DHA2 family multidrug resistance protein